MQRPEAPRRRVAPRDNTALLEALFPWSVWLDAEGALEQVGPALSQYLAKNDQAGVLGQHVSSIFQELSGSGLSDSWDPAEAAGKLCVLRTCLQDAASGRLLQTQAQLKGTWVRSDGAEAATARLEGAQGCSWFFSAHELVTDSKPALMCRHNLSTPDDVLADPSDDRSALTLQGYDEPWPAGALRVQRDTFTGALVRMVQTGVASSHIDPDVGRTVLDLIAGSVDPGCFDVAQPMDDAEMRCVDGCDGYYMSEAEGSVDARPGAPGIGAAGSRSSRSDDAHLTGASAGAEMYAAAPLSDEEQSWAPGNPLSPGQGLLRHNNAKDGGPLIRRSASLARSVYRSDCMDGSGNPSPRAGAFASCFWNRSSSSSGAAPRASLSVGFAALPARASPPCGTGQPRRKSLMYAPAAGSARSARSFMMPRPASCNGGAYAASPPSGSLNDYASSSLLTRGPGVLYGMHGVALELPLQAPLREQDEGAAPPLEPGEAAALPLLLRAPGDRVMAALRTADEWGFDAFELSDATGGRPLSALAYFVFVRTDLAAALALDETKLARFLVEVEDGYNANPYHNATHAADVLRTLYVIATRGGLFRAMYRPRPLGHGRGGGGGGDSDSASGGSDGAGGGEGAGGAATCAWLAIPSGMRVAVAAGDVVALAAVFLAAITHDFNHVGLTNAFLVRSEHPLAVRYNDQSPMENHHVACSLSLLRAADNDVLGHLPGGLRTELRRRVIDMVLATDMAHHADVMACFHARMRAAHSNGGSGRSGGGVGAAAGHCVRQQHSRRDLSSGGGADPPAGLVTIVLPSTDAGADADAKAQPPSPTASSGGGGGGSPAQSALLADMHMDEQTQVLCLKVALKCADLGHLAAPESVHRRWVECLEEEMFRQGDKERLLGFSVSPLMDRSKDGITKSQTGFFDAVVLPLYASFSDALPSMKPLLRQVKRNRAMWAEQEAARAVAADCAAEV